MRSWLARGFFLATAISAVAVFAVLLIATGTIVVRGLPAIDRTFLFTATVGSGEGGVLYQLVGTLILIGTALAVSLPLAIGLALAATVYLPRPRLRRSALALLYTANGIPSVLVGIAGFLVFSHWLGWGKSWLAGGLLLALMILPAESVALIERIESLPRRYLDAAYGLGLNRSQVARAVVLRQSWNGLFSGALLGLARAAGETAPILFAAAVFSGATVPRGIRESPVLALPYHVFVLAQDSFAAGGERHLWGAALVLLCLVATLSLVALPSRLRAHEESRHG
ncbi:MAG TPA: ABC transporter permease subunit [Thermoanaerobaculia bacterium]|nr:ABC transporter permease subunit [Thermoanaerobaculia bacterium]